MLILYKFILVGVICIYSSTSTNAEDHVTFIAIGDWGTGSPWLQLPVAEQMAIWAEDNPIDFIMSTGDNFYMDGVASVDDAQFDWKWRSVYNHRTLRDVPWYLSIGNHDYGFERSGVEWNQVAFSQVEPRWNFPDLWYSYYYDIGDTGYKIHFIAIDTECLVHENNNHTDMAPWLDNELENSEGDWIIVFGHMPIYSAGSYGPYVDYMREDILPVLEKHLVHMFICGHDHNMQLLNYNDGTGTEYVVSGGGGTLTYAYNPEAEEILDRELGIGTDYFNETRGFVAVTLSAEQMYLEFVDVEGDLQHTHSRDRW